MEKESLFVNRELLWMARLKRRIREGDTQPGICLVAALNPTSDSGSVLGSPLDANRALED